MAAQFFGVGNVARKVKSEYMGVGNVARKVTNGYIGVDNVARKFYTGSTTIVKQGTGGFNDSGVVTFDSVVPAFTSAIVRIDVPGINRAIYDRYGNHTGKTFVVPYGDGSDVDNPLSWSFTYEGQTCTYDYEYWDGEDLVEIRLSVTLTRSTLSAEFTILYLDGESTKTGYSSYIGDAFWKVTFTCE